MKPKIIVVCGPTASGKTRLAIELAKVLNGEIISADSMQIYKELNIGTAKPTVCEMSGVPHFLIDIVSVASIKSDEFFNVAEYVRLANACADDIISRGKVPIVCGGTGLYIDNFINNTRFAESENDFEYRKYLDGFSSEELHDMLSEIDPKSAETIHANNKKRIIRALEIYKITGKTKAETDAQSRLAESEYDFVKFGLQYSERDLLYSRIDKRVDIMIESGLLSEVENLLEYEANIRRIGAIGYVEILDYLCGIHSFDEAVEMIKRNTRRYAKRQITWFKRDTATNWIDVTDMNEQNIEDYVHNIVKCLKNI